jgi:hypothetical protein
MDGERVSDMRSISADAANRQDAKVAKEEMGSFLYSSSSWRLGGSR